MRSRSLMVACAVVLLAAGCKRGERGRESAGDAAVGTTTITSADARVMLDSTVARLVTARCQRELECDNIGDPARRYVNLQACWSVVRAEATKELNIEACPRGVRESEVVQCLSAIERSDCYDPIAAITRIEHCHKDRICL